MPGHFHAPPPSAPFPSPPSVFMHKNVRLCAAAQTKALMEIALLPCLSFGRCLGRAGCIIFSGRRPHVDLPNLRLAALHCTNLNQECSSGTALYLNHMEGIFCLRKIIFFNHGLLHISMLFLNISNSNFQTVNLLKLCQN